MYVGNHHQDWSDVLPAVGFAICTATNAATGFPPPFSCLDAIPSILDKILDAGHFCWEVAHPSIHEMFCSLFDALSLVKQASKQVKALQRAKYDALHCPSSQFTVGNFVFVDAPVGS
ncbi:hypothetical protein CHUAL_009633 [Chamberlinius hualienensis]